VTCSVLHDGFYPGALCTYGIIPMWKAGGLYTLVKRSVSGRRWVSFLGKERHTRCDTRLGQKLKLAECGAR